MFKLSLSLILSLLTCFLYGQSFRGLAPLNDTVCWVSGSKGTVIKTENGGASWDTISPAGFSTKEFRDIHVYDHKRALLMSSGEKAVILRTVDGGKSWQTVHSNNRPGVFYDAMDAFGPFVMVIG
ncbi:MAG: WD40/YVTN/BNR-like repeat-containing protein, partial [Bacteroidia bacterium]